MSAIEQRLQRLRSECAEAGGQLLAVAKRQPIERILAAYRGGQRDFAHSYVQEAIAVRQALADQMPEARWHFIGRIQSNKTRDLIDGWHRIHSVDRLRIAKRLGSAQALIQVRLGGEHSKAGVDPADLPTLLDQIRQHSQLRLRGLMALPPPISAWGDNNFFLALAQQRDELMRDGLLPPDGGELSMGTSGDYRLALAAGSDWLRIGSELFGPRVG